MGIDFWRTTAIISAAIGQTLFILLYVTFPWWRTFLGRALFYKALSFGVLLDVAVMGRMFDWKYEDATFVCLYFLLSTGIWVQFGAFIRVKATGRRIEMRTGHE